MYIETSTGKFGDVARLVSPMFTVSVFYIGQLFNFGVAAAS